MKALVAWRVMTNERGRTVLVITGIFVATLLMFLQLGFYYSVPRAGTLMFEAAPFDIMLTSKAYIYQGNPHSFPRRRLYQAASLPGVEMAAPLYIDAMYWLSIEDKTMRGATILGYALDKPVFDNASITSLQSVLSRPDTIIVDSDTRPMFGKLYAGRKIELDMRQVEIGGVYELGTGFVGLAVALTSDINFQRIFPGRGLHEVNMGLVRLKPGADLDAVVAAMKAIMPPDTRVQTRAEFFEQEQNRWTRSTSTGLIFGFGAVVALIVGMIILYQMLATQISRDLPQFATLKAIGYTDRDLAAIVVGVSVLMSAVAFPLALGAAILIYDVVRGATLLPIEMSMARAVAVLVLIQAMSVGSAMLATQRLRQADPAEIF